MGGWGWCVCVCVCVRGCAWGEIEESKGWHIPTDSDRMSAPPSFWRNTITASSNWLWKKINNAYNRSIQCEDFVLPAGERGVGSSCFATPITSFIWGVESKFWYYMCIILQVFSSIWYGIKYRIACNHGDISRQIKNAKLTSLSHPTVVGSHVVSVLVRRMWGGSSCFKISNSFSMPSQDRKISLCFTSRM